MRVLLADASGILGLHIARELRAAKHDVIGLSRSQSGAAQLRELGVEPLVADLLDRDQLLRATAGMNADAAIHAATALRTAPMRHNGMAGTDALRTAGTRNVVDAPLERTGQARARLDARLSHVPRRHPRDGSASVDRPDAAGHAVATST